MGVYRILAFLMLVLHLLWLAWVIFGCLFTRGRRILRWVHIGCVIYGLGITLSPYPCPLTLAEHFFQSKAGAAPYTETFIERMVEWLVYPDVPLEWLTWGGVAVCTWILGVYAWRFHRRRITGAW